VRELVDRGYAVIGSPDTVRSRLEDYQKELGFGYLCPMFQFGSLSHEDFSASLGLFAQKVMPALRPLGET
jgi:alkanesulfonate monooxygenase SsuD/methylene tetrahydromethanopterin reductase-like flavin-dependent oxidoreductase (luciferase family)